MNILDQIVEQKKREVAELKNSVPIKKLEQGDLFLRPTISLKEHILRKDKSGIIAEFKRKSPSKGIINSSVSVEQTTAGYVRAGASALSILTDREFFGGNSVDLTNARKVNSCPILRKDFIIDEYQIVEAKSIGADAILLIVSILEPDQIASLSKFAKSLGLEILVEVHSLDELYPDLFSATDLIGVNNRDLKTFDVNINVSKKLAEFIPDNIVKISESGISSPDAIIELKKYGYNGFLMGENFMKNKSPELAAKEFIESLNQLSSASKD